MKRFSRAMEENARQEIKQGTEKISCSLKNENNIDNDTGMAEKLTLGKLKSCPGSTLTVFFSLLGSGIAFYETSLFKHLTEIRIGLEKSFGYSVADSTSLAHNSAAVNIDFYVVFSHGIGELKGLHQHLACSINREKLLNRLVVYNDFAFSGLEPCTGNGHLPFAGGVKNVLLFHQSPELYL
jgi:hypothetical protein